MDFKYIIIRASSALLLLSGPLFTACDDDDPDAFITVSKQEIEVEYNGLTANGETVNFDLGSNHAWQATYVEEWIHPTHTEGDRGRTRIFLAIDENDTGKDREGYVIFEGGGSRRTVAVTQKLKIDALMVSPGKLTVVRSGLLETGEKASVYIREQRLDDRALRGQRLDHSLENLGQSRRRGRRADDRPEYDRRRAYRHIRRGRRFEACDRHRDPEPRGAESFRNVVQGQ